MVVSVVSIKASKGQIKVLSQYGAGVDRHVVPCFQICYNLNALPPASENFGVKGVVTFELGFFFCFAFANEPMSISRAMWPGAGHSFICSNYNRHDLT